MRRLLGLLAGLVLVTGLGVIVLVLPAASPAAADPIGECTTTSGTIVAVDFAHFGGPIVRGCGVNEPSGYALLHAAGFTTQGDAEDGAAFICRLGNAAFRRGTEYPTPAQDPCDATPPSSAYWSYWLAPAGQNTWSFSQESAMSNVPEPGEVEAWVFGGTDAGGTSASGVPNFTPASVRAENSKPVTPATSTPRPTTKSRPSQASTSTTTTAVASSTTVRTAPPSSTVATTSTSAAAPTRSTTATPASTGPRIVSALPAPRRQESAGSAAPVLAAAGLTALLGASTAVAVRRRKRQDA